MITGISEMLMLSVMNWDFPGPVLLPENPCLEKEDVSVVFVSVLCILCGSAVAQW